MVNELSPAIGCKRSTKVRGMSGRKYLTGFRIPWYCKPCLTHLSEPLTNRDCEPSSPKPINLARSSNGHDRVGFGRYSTRLLCHLSTKPSPKAILARRCRSFCNRLGILARFDVQSEKAGIAANERSCILCLSRNDKLCLRSLDNERGPLNFVV